MPWGVPQSGRGDEPSSTDSLQPKPRACASGRMWHVGEVEYLWAVMWECGLDRKVPSQNTWEGFFCQLLYYPAKGRQPATHTYGSVSLRVRGGPRPSQL